MPQKLHSSLILVAVFALGIAAGIGGVVWAWPAMRTKIVRPHHETLAEYFKRVYSINLTPAQVSQIKAIYNDTLQHRHELHTQFVPQYSKICDDYTTTRKQERDAYAPIHQDEQNKLQAALTPQQWQAVEQHDARQPASAPRPPDVCRHLYPPGQAPNGGAPGNGPHAGPPPDGRGHHYF